MQKQGTIKVLLVHESFFETIKIQDLISESFLQVLEERLEQKDLHLSNELKDLLFTLFSEQENFSKVRTVNRASVKLRFRIMTEVKAEGNILNSNKYLEILDNTLNLVLPYHNDKDKELALKKMSFVFEKKYLEKFNLFPVKHHFNGYFIVFQTAL